MIAMICRIYEKTGMILRFAIGEVPSEHAAAVQEEEKQHGAFLRIPIERVCLPDMNAFIRDTPAQSCEHSSCLRCCAAAGGRSYQGGPSCSLGLHVPAPMPALDAL